MKCPHCGLFNPPSALRCDCGWDFASNTLQESYIRQPTPASARTQGDKKANASSVTEEASHMRLWLRPRGVEELADLIGPLSLEEVQRRISAGTLSPDMEAAVDSGQSWSALRGAAEWFPLSTVLSREGIWGTSPGSPAVRSEDGTFEPGGPAARQTKTRMAGRYDDAYGVARNTIAFGGFIKGAGVAVAILALGLGAAVDQGGIGLAAGAVIGLGGGGTLFGIGVGISAQGQLLLATLDTAVNTSAILTRLEKERIVAT